MVICLERGADLHMAQLMPLPLTVSCFSKIQIGFAFLVPADPDSPWQRAVKWVCVCRNNQRMIVVCCSTDIISKNIALAAQKIKQYNVMPVYGEWLCVHGPV